VDAPFDFIKSVTASGYELRLNHGASVTYFSRFRGRMADMRELSVNAAPLIAEYTFKQVCPRDVEM